LPVTLNDDNDSDNNGDNNGENVECRDNYCDNVCENDGDGDGEGDGDGDDVATQIKYPSFLPDASRQEYIVEGMKNIALKNIEKFILIKKCLKVSYQITYCHNLIQTFVTTHRF
jgi:hypothetical protein